MSLNKSIARDAALEQFGELDYTVRRGPHLAPNKPATEQDSVSEIGRLREVFPHEIFSSLKSHTFPLCDTLPPNPMSGKLRPTTCYL